MGAGSYRGGRDSQEVAPFSSKDWMEQLRNNYVERMEREVEDALKATRMDAGTRMELGALDWSMGTPPQLLQAAKMTSVRVIRYALPVDARKRVIRRMEPLPLREVVEVRADEAGRRLDPSLPWAPGALPMGAGAQPGRAKVCHSNLGLVFVDQGADCSIVSQSVAETYPGGQLVDLPEEVAVFGAGAAGAEDDDDRPVVRKPLFVATQKLVVEFTVLWSVDCPERSSAVGLKPIQRQVGATVEFLVCPDQRVLAGMVQGVPDLQVVLGEEVETRAQFKAFMADVAQAMRGEMAMWSHEQRHSLRGVVRGVQGAEDVPLFTAANVFDYNDGEDLPFGDRSPFELDKELDMTEEAPTPDRGASALPKTLEAMEAHLLRTLPRTGKVVQKYIKEIARVFLENREVMLSPHPSTAPIDIPIKHGSVPTRIGLRRRVPEEALPALNEEVRGLMKFGMVVEVDAPLGQVPPDLWVNALVVAVRRVPPGSPPGTKPKVRMCVDCGPANAAAAANVKTKLPNLEKHVRATAGKCLFSSLDSPNSFHQLRLSEAASNLMGFSLKDDATGRLRYYKYVGAPFGFRDFPALFTEYMLGILEETDGCPLSTASAFIDDTLLVTEASGGFSLDEVWGTDAEETVVRNHLLLLETTLASYVKHGLVIRLDKCDILQGDISVCGFHTDGKALRVDPSRSEGWNNIGKPDSGVTLAYLQMVLGIANYVQGYLPPDYVKADRAPLRAGTRSLKGNVCG